MKERKTIVKFIFLCMVIIGFTLCTIGGTQVSPAGGSDELSAVLLEKEEVKIKILLKKGSQYRSYYAYWDDEKNAKKLRKCIFFARGKISAPETKGVHRLTIITGYEKINYYYDIRGKSL